MKPRIFWYWDAWWCHGNGCTKEGATPRSAYFKWLAWEGVEEVLA